MRKNDLIKLLQEVEGNPEVVLWNGYVQDYQHINPDLHKGTLVKDSLEYYIENVRNKRCVRLKNCEFQLSEDELLKVKENYKKYCKWEINSFVSEEDIKNKLYKKKNVLYIQPKPRGEKFQDRLGSVKY